MAELQELVGLQECPAFVDHASNDPLASDSVLLSSLSDYGVSTTEMSISGVRYVGERKGGHANMKMFPDRVEHYSTEAPQEHYAVAGEEKQHFQSSKCLVCDSRLQSAGSKYDIYAIYVVDGTDEFLMCAKLQDILCVQMSHLSHSSFVCHKCFSLIQDTHILEKKLTNIKQHLFSLFTSTAGKNGLHFTTEMEEAASNEKTDFVLQTRGSDDREAETPEGDSELSRVQSKEVLQKNSVDHPVEKLSKTRRQPRRKSKSKIRDFKLMDRGAENVSEEENTMVITRPAVNISRADCTEDISANSVDKLCNGRQKQREMFDSEEIFPSREVFPKQLEKQIKEKCSNREAMTTTLKKKMENGRHSSRTPLQVEIKDDPIDCGEMTEKDLKKRWTCNICGLTVTSAGRLSQHILSKHDEPYRGKDGVQCKKCARILPPNEDHKCRVFFCEVCGAQLYSKGQMKKHLLTHEEYRPFQCLQCEKAFQRKEYLNLHMRTHTDERPYTCEFCPRAFRSRSHYNNHRRTHTGQKPYVCQYCGKSFSMPQNLMPHLKTHTGKRGFQCDCCSKAFYTSGDLKKHVRTHTGEKPYQCSVCGKCFASRTNCQTHERIHSKTTKVWSCEVCGKGFPRKAKMQAHAATHRMKADSVEEKEEEEENKSLDRVMSSGKGSEEMEEFVYENEVIVPIQRGDEVEVSCEGQQVYVVEVFTLPSSE